MSLDYLIILVHESMKSNSKLFPWTLDKPNTAGNEIAVITGESSWLINFHDISSGVLKNLSQSTLARQCNFYNTLPSQFRCICE